MSRASRRRVRPVWRSSIQLSVLAEEVQYVRGDLMTGPRVRCPGPRAATHRKHGERVQGGCRPGRRQGLIAAGEELGPQRIHHLHDGRNRAPVPVERHDAVRIGGDQGFGQARVGALEAHDGLLDVADDQRARRLPGKGPEKGELDRVGVLELVDDDAVDAAQHGVADIVVGAQQALGIAQHVGKVDDAEGALALCIAGKDRLGAGDQRGGMHAGVLERPGWVWSASAAAITAAANSS
jgi:hypothetical protein